MMVVSFRQGVRSVPEAPQINIDIDHGLSDKTLDALMVLSGWADPPPWRAWIEDRDHTSGASFIMVGREDDRDEDMYISRDSGAAGDHDLDMIAAARNYLPILVAEVRRLREQLAATQ
jgi:hypothetical protein